MKLFSGKSRPVHLGPYPLERLRRHAAPVDPGTNIPFANLSFDAPTHPHSILTAMEPFQAVMDAVRAGARNRHRVDIPSDPTTRAHHLKAFGYFNDASMMGVCALSRDAFLRQPRENPAIADLVDDLKHLQTRTLAAGVDAIMADLRDTAGADGSEIFHHTRAIVILVAYPRDPRPDELGSDWITDAQPHRAALRATENATVLAEYLRILGCDARAHSATASDVHLPFLSVAAGLTIMQNGDVHAPWLGKRFGLAAVTTDMDLIPDMPLCPLGDQPAWVLSGPVWQLGTHGGANASSHDPYARRNFADGPHPFETLKRVATPTTYIDAPNVPRVPKRTDMFARGQFGDMGPKVQDAMKDGQHIVKSAPAAAQRRLLGALILLQDGRAAAPPPTIPPDTDPKRNAANLKAAAYFLGVDAAGLSACPDWTWYSHDATGTPLTPPHDHALSVVIDQGFDTMDGASGDDWISTAQSMRAYLRFSVLGGILARHLRNLGHLAKAHTVMDGDVLQPPLLLLSGLGEVSRIGEVILNPFLGPRLKSGVVTHTMPVGHDKPIDFGLQTFCEACNKCARECPAGAITAGPKKMFNGYEIWKSDSQKCATYRITNKGGSMCGRCMKTCPWNLEGLFAEAPFRWAASTIPKAAPLLARLDDALGRGGLNPVKKWWWDIERQRGGDVGAPDHPVNARDLQRDLILRAEDQTMAVYPAPLAPHPWPFPDPMNREAGIAAHSALLPPDDHRTRSAAGDTAHLHRYAAGTGTPVLDLRIAAVQHLDDHVTLYDLTRPDQGVLPQWTAGAHLDLVVAPEYLRPYSLLGDPADRRRYCIAVAREDAGRGGSALLHRIFTQGRRVFAASPVNAFDLVEDAPHSLLMGGGIGVTPMIAFAHRLHALGRPFDLHYSAPTRAAAAFSSLLAQVPWARRVHLHVSAEDTRVDIPALMAQAPDGGHAYICGPDRYMQAAMAAGRDGGVSTNRLHMEYFTPPARPAYTNHPFTLRLPDGRQVPVRADQTASEALIAADIKLDIKCADGICGVCKCTLLSGRAEHRDFVLSAAQRKTSMILCQSRAADPNGVLEIEL